MAVVVRAQVAPVALDRVPNHWLNREHIAGTMHAPSGQYKRLMGTTQAPKPVQVQIWVATLEHKQFCFGVYMV